MAGTFRDALYGLAQVLPQTIQVLNYYKQWQFQEQQLGLEKQRVGLEKERSAAYITATEESVKMSQAERKKLEELAPLEVERIKLENEINKRMTDAYKAWDKTHEQPFEVEQWLAQLDELKLRSEQLKAQIVEHQKSATYYTQQTELIRMQADVEANEYVLNMASSIGSFNDPKASETAEQIFAENTDPKTGRPDIPKISAALRDAKIPVESQKNLDRISKFTDEVYYPLYMNSVSTISSEGAQLFDGYTNSEAKNHDAAKKMLAPLVKMNKGNITAAVNMYMQQRMEQPLNSQIAFSTQRLLERMGLGDYMVNIMYPTGTTIGDLQKEPPPGRANYGFPTMSQVGQAAGGFVRENAGSLTKGASPFSYEYEP